MEDLRDGSCGTHIKFHIPLSLPPRTLRSAACVQRNHDFERDSLALGIIYVSVLAEPFLQAARRRSDIYP